MKIIRVVCTPDGVCREPGDIIERDFVPDESLTPAATRQEGGTVRAGRIEFARNAGQKPALAQESCTLIPRTVSRYVIQRKARTVVEKTADGEKSIVENAAVRHDHIVGHLFHRIEGNSDPVIALFIYHQAVRVQQHPVTCVGQKYGHGDLHVILI